MTIGGICPWYGSKRTMAPTIVRALGPHTNYWEIFAGSMATLLYKPRSRMEVVNDLHGDLINLSRTLQHPALGPALYRRLRRVLCSEAEFRDALAVVRGRPAPDAASMPDADRAFAYFVSSWQGMNGVAGTTRGGVPFARRFSGTGGDPARRWAGAVGSIPAWRERLGGVTVLQGDAIELAGKIADETSTVAYVDPPYFLKGARYLHDFAADDHARLAAALTRFRRTRVVLSYYMDDALATLYPGWHVLPVKASKGLTNQGKRGGGGATDAPEVLLSNLPFPAGMPGCGPDGVPLVGGDGDAFDRMTIAETEGD